MFMPCINARTLGCSCSWDRETAVITAARSVGRPAGKSLDRPGTRHGKANATQMVPSQGRPARIPSCKLAVAMKDEQGLGR